ncbi:MAG: hemolysin family protein [Bacteroidota bacterium]
MDPYPIIGILFSLLTAAFFSGIEMAFLAASKTHIELLSKQKILTGLILLPFIKRPTRLIGTTLVGHILSLVMYGVFVAYTIHLVSGQLPRGGITQTLLMLGVILVGLLIALALLLLVDFLSKSLFSLNPERSLTIFAVPMWLLSWVVMWPLVVPILFVSRAIITKLFRMEYSVDKPAFRLTDLNQYLNNLNKKENEKDESEVDTRIFNNALDFKTVRVRDCLVPRTELTAVALTTPMEEVRQTFVESGHSKVLVYQETIDNVLGYCHALALFKKPTSVAQILTPIIIVPETMLANELLVRFTNEHKSLALVVDEFGGTSGLVSLEDVMEKIFGEIQDEYDVSEDWVEQKLDDYNYILSARQEIDYLNEKYGWNIPVGDYDTLGGFIISINEAFPEINEIISHPPFTFTILSMEDTRIDMVKLTLDEDFEPEAYS